MCVNGIFLSQLTLTTFVVTFFVGQSLSFYRSCYGFARSIASRLADLNLMLATHVARDASSYTYTARGRALLDAGARNTRLFHLLYWAHIVPRYRAVCSEAGLQRLCALGHCTRAEADALLALPRSARHHAVAVWIVERARVGYATGALARGGRDDVTAAWMERSTALRSAYGKIGQALGARMPTVYVHLVQVLVDSLLVLTPLALYARLGVAAVPLSSAFVVFYRGLVDVCKSFLDPFGNSNTAVEIQVPVLVRDCNVASARFVAVAEVIPQFETAPPPAPKAPPVLEEVDENVP